LAFGDGTDPDSQVSRLMRSQRGFRLLESLDTRPSVVYLKKANISDA
jgi:hypothetical protein